MSFQCELQWEVEPVSRDVGEAVMVEAAGRSDIFVDPSRSATVLNGARGGAQ